MFFPPHLPERIYAFAASAKAVLTGFFWELRSRALAVMDRLTEKAPLKWVPSERRRPLAMGLAGVLVVLPLVFALARGGGTDKPAEQAEPAPNELPGREIIPYDDVFLPMEPDFIPGVMLERERRTAWTADDAEPWWRDPLKNGEEPWRGLIEKTVDEILERVP